MSSPAANSIAKKVMSHLRGLSGIGDSIEQCDDEIQQEIKEALAKIVDDELLNMIK